MQLQQLCWGQKFPTTGTLLSFSHTFVNRAKRPNALPIPGVEGQYAIVVAIGYNDAVASRVNGNAPRSFKLRGCAVGGIALAPFADRADE